MTRTAHNAHDMIAGMSPELNSGRFVFASIADKAQADAAAQVAIGSFREAEGMSFLLPENNAAAMRLDVSQPMRCITLNVYSSLEGVGLTAAVASALGAEAIPCNMVAACHHDHVFVPANMAERALDVLRSLQQSEAGRD